VHGNDPGGCRIGRFSYASPMLQKGRMAGRFFLVLTAACLTIQGCKPPGLKVERDRDGEEHLLLLQNTRAVLGILPEAGGRAVVYRRPWDKNLLDADPGQWDSTARPVPTPPPAMSWQNYGGHTHWLAPRTGWWIGKERNWPPDPWWEFGRFQLIENSSVHAVLKGPVSPVSGTSFLKRIRLHPDGSVTCQTTVTNHTPAPRTLGIWSNTRFKTRASVYVPLQEPASDSIRIESVENKAPTPYLIEDGFFSFPRQIDFSNHSVRSSRFFVQSTRPLIAAIYRDALFIKRITDASPGSSGTTKPDHAPVEISYRAASPSSEQGSLLELGLHSPSATLRPGKSYTVTEEWQLLDYQQQNMTTAEISFLKGIIKRRND